MAEAQHTDADCVPWPPSPSTGRSGPTVTAHPLRWGGGGVDFSAGPEV